ncbi:MAG: phage holin family protein [Chloroflexi bacterium]|nr:phage holin family protein [Chloroflexota bacterium]
MTYLIIRLIANSVALYLAAVIVPGIEFQGGLVAIVALGLIFGAVNAVIGPILKFATCLINVMTLGLFTFVINAFLFWLAAWLGGLVHIGFRINGVVPILIGSIFVTIVSAILTAVLGGFRRE